MPPKVTTNKPLYVNVEEMRKEYKEYEAKEAVVRKAIQEAKALGKDFEMDDFDGTDLRVHTCHDEMLAKKWFKPGVKLARDYKKNLIDQYDNPIAVNEDGTLASSPIQREVTTYSSGLKSEDEGGPTREEARGLFADFELFEMRLRICKEEGVAFAITSKQSYVAIRDLLERAGVDLLLITGGIHGNPYVDGIEYGPGDINLSPLAQQERDLKNKEVALKQEREALRGQGQELDEAKLQDLQDCVLSQKGTGGAKAAFGKNIVDVGIRPSYASLLYMDDAEKKDREILKALGATVFGGDGEIPPLEQGSFGRVDANELPLSYLNDNIGAENNGLNFKNFSKFAANISKEFADQMVSLAPAAIITENAYGNAEAIREQLAQANLQRNSTLRKASLANVSQLVEEAQQIAAPKLDVAKKVNEMLSIYKENVGNNNEGAAAPIKGILNNLKNIFTLGGVNRKQRRDAEYRNKEEKKFLIESVEKLMSNKDFDMNSFIKEGIYINTPSPFALLIETLDEKSQEAIDLRGAIKAAQEKSPKVAWGVSLGGANNSQETSTDGDFPPLPLKESQEQLKQLLIEKANSSPSNVERLVNGSSESFAIVGGMAIEGAANGVPGVVISTISFGKSGVQFFTTSDKMVVGEDFVIKACEAVPGIGKEAVHPFAVTDPGDRVGGAKGVSGSADSGFMGSADSVLDMIRSPYFDNKAVKDLGGNEKTGNHFYSLKLSGEEEVIIRSNSNQDISVASAKHALGDGGRLRSDVRMAQFNFKYEPLESSQYKDAIMNLLSASPSNQPRSASAMSLNLGQQLVGDQRV